MFKQDSFLLFPPEILRADQRVLFQATAFSLIAAHRSLMAVRNITAQRIRQHNNEDYSDDELMELYSRLWTVVDEIHSLTVCIRMLNKRRESGFAMDFVHRYKAASQMRNVRDHLKNNLGNLAQTRKSRATVLGHLSYMRYTGEETRNGVRVHTALAVTIPFGIMTHPSHSYGVINPGEHKIKDIPCLFEFSALDETLKLDGLFEDLPQLADHLDDVLTVSVTAQAEAAKAGGEPITFPLAQGTDIKAFVVQMSSPKSDPG